MDGTSKRFGLERVTDLYELNWKLMDIFDFLERNLPQGADLQGLEYAAINGLLSTLDPHSVLLDAEVYREMQVGTEGRFGGLGVVISVKDGALTIMSVMPETPAAGVGLMSGDRLVQIGEESTINMPLSDAVTRLRGAPGTEVVLWIEREGLNRPKAYPIVREEIQIRSVEHQDLGDGIGYVHIRNFQSNTYDDLQGALQELRKAHQGNLEGLVIDLRENPGGLLEQAVQISDIFLDTGTIVTTVREGARQRDERHARRADTLNRLPLVVLINRGSASASEILAGALKHNDRAVIVGRQSFGKGSVQVVYKLDDAALKLTVAQYLTPGDISIQSVGIVPDVEMLTLTVDADKMDLRPDDIRGEAALTSHLDSSKTLDVRPSVRLKSLGVSSSPREPAVDKDTWINFAKGFLKNSKALNRHQALSKAKGFVTEWRMGEEARLVDRLEKLGVDWHAGGEVKSSLKASIQIEDAASGQVISRGTGGQAIRLKATVRNEGSRTVHRLHGVVSSKIRALDGLECVFGRIDPGESREWSVNVTLARSTESHGDVLELELYQGTSKALETVSLPFEVRALARPRFAHTVWLDDGPTGDGLIQRGEELELVVQVTNQGRGVSDEVLVTIKNESGEGVFIRKGRQRLKSLAPGESGQARFVVAVREVLEGQLVQLQLRVVDQALRVWSQHALNFSVYPRSDKAVPKRALVSVGTKALEIRAGAHEDTGLVGLVQAGGVVQVERSLAQWFAVKWGADSSLGGWIARDQVSMSVDKQEASGTIESVLQAPPPDLRIDANIYSNLVTDKASLRLSGTARFSSDDGIGRRDVFVYRGDDKIHLVSAGPNEATVSLSVDVPLKLGANQLTIVASENDQSMTRRRVTVYRR